MGDSTSASPGPARPAHPGPGRGWGWLAAALVVGLVRFHRLGDWSLWIDEVYTLADAYHGQGNYNPLGYWIVRAVVEACGTPATELSLRLAPAVAGWLAIPLTWWAFRTVAGDRRAGIAALFVALSTWQVYWAQTARFYTLVQLPALVGTGIALRALAAGSSARALAGLAVIGAGVLLQLQAAVLAGAWIVAPFLVQLVAERGERRDPRRARVARALLWVGLVALVAGASWVLGVFGRYQHVKEASPLSSVAHLARTIGFYLTPVLSVAALVGAVAAWRARDRDGVLVAGLVVSGLVAVALAATLARASAQYAIVLMPLVALLAAWPVELPPLAPSRAARAAWVALVALPLAAGTALYFGVRHGERPRWREAYAFVDQERGEHDVLLGMQASVGEYYLVPGKTDLRDPEVVAWNDETNAYAWLRWARRERPMWIVVRPDFLQQWPFEARRDFVAFLTEECHMVRRFDVHMEGRDLDVEVYRRP